MNFKGVSPNDVMSENKEYMLIDKILRDLLFYNRKLYEDKVARHVFSI